MAFVDYTQFHQVFPPDLGSPYAPDLIREIETYRKSFDGVLFIDRVLKALGVTKAKSYPPKGDNGLHELHQKVCQSKMSAHHKLSVLYYLLLDHDDILGVRSQLAEQFCQKTGIPNKYQIFMKGLWHMDRQQFHLALEYLAHPSLLPEFADDIISILVSQAQDGDYTWALAYYHSVQPVLKTAGALELLFGAMAHTSVSEALFFSRSQPEPTRRLLFERLVQSVHDTDASVAGSREQRARALTSLPLDMDEDTWFEEFLTSVEGKKLKNARDTWALRKFATNQLSEVGDEKLRARLAALGRPH